MQKIIFGVMGLVLAGCVGTAVPTDAECDDAARNMGGHYSYPNVRIEKLFGLNDGVLANTNLFPATSNSWQHYNLNLGKNENGFTTCTVHMERDAKTGRLALEYVELERTLNLGADDAELLDECRNAVGWLNDKLGTDMELKSLADLQMMRTRCGMRHGRVGITLCHTSVYADLAEDQQIHLAAHDAVFMKRGDEYVEMAPASIEITIRVGKEVRRKWPKIKRAVRQEDGKIIEVPDEEGPVDVHGVEIGMDVSEKLSKAVKMREQERPRMARPVGGKKGP